MFRPVEIINYIVNFLILIAQLTNELINIIKNMLVPACKLKLSSDV